MPSSPRLHPGLALVASLLLLATVGCGRPSDASGADPASVTAATPPVRMVACHDQTLSMDRLWSPAVTTDHLRACAEIVKQRGGDLLFLLIRSHSGTTPGPTLHVDPPMPPPMRPAKGGDAFDDADAAVGYQKVREEYEERERQRLAEADAAIEVFLAEVEPLLALKPDRAGTDIARMRERAARFLEDPDLPHQVPADRYLLVVSDGKDTVHAAPMRRFSKPVSVLLVSAAGPGVFAGDKPIVFSSITAATRYLKHGGR